MKLKNVLPLMALATAPIVSNAQTSDTSALDNTKGKIWVQPLDPSALKLYPTDSAQKKFSKDIMMVAGAQLKPTTPTGEIKPEYGGAFVGASRLLAPNTKASVGNFYSPAAGWGNFASVRLDQHLRFDTTENAAAMNFRAQQFIGIESGKHSLLTHGELTKNGASLYYNHWNFLGNGYEHRFGANYQRELILRWHKFTASADVARILASDPVFNRTIGTIGMGKDLGKDFNLSANLQLTKPNKQSVNTRVNLTLAKKFNLSDKIRNNSVQRKG